MDKEKVNYFVKNFIYSLLSTFMCLVSLFFIIGLPSGIDKSLFAEGLSSVSFIVLSVFNLVFWVVLCRFCMRYLAKKLKVKHTNVF